MNKESAQVKFNGIVEEIKFLEPSAKGEHFLMHVCYMQVCDELPEHFSFALDKKRFDLKILTEVATSKSVGNKVFAVLEHEESFEVRRLPDNTDLRLFYRYLARNKFSNEGSKSNSERVSKATEVLKDYTRMSFEEIEKYKASITEFMKNQNVLSYSYIHKRLAQIAIFRNSLLGSTSEIKSVIEDLISMEFLEEVPKEVRSSLFNSNAKMYKILRIE